MVASIRVDTSEMDRALRKYGEQARRTVEISAQRAVTKTARNVRAAAIKEMERVFDRPTRWTLNALTVEIDKKNIAASVQVKDGYWYRADNYLQVQIEGGSRPNKAFEKALQRVGVLPAGWFAVPGQGAKLDAYGNQSPGEIRQILSWFDAAELVAGSTQNMREKGRARLRKGTRRRAAQEYFAVLPGRRGPRGAVQRLRPGIYRRTFFGFGSAIKPVMIFVSRVSYSKRFYFEEVSRRVVERDFNKIFAEDFTRRMARRTAGPP